LECFIWLNDEIGILLMLFDKETLWNISMTPIQWIPAKCYSIYILSLFPSSNFYARLHFEESFFLLK
jgi:hypothetical protein